jgi:soluble lytic murein transglycosylase-like protein
MIFRFSVNKTSRDGEGDSSCKALFPSVMEVRMRHILGVSIFLGLFLALCPARADIYRYVDENGVIHFTNVPADKRYRVYIASGSSVSRYDRALHEPIIREMSARYRVDSDLVRAVIKAESDFNPNAVSNKGAKGLMQLMPETAQDMQVRNIFSPRENVEGGVKYLRRLLDMFNNNLSLTLAAYNAGENVVKDNNNAIPPYPETIDYVQRVLRFLRNYKTTARLNP